MRQWRNFSAAIAIALCLCGSARADVASDVCSKTCEDTGILVANGERVTQPERRSAVKKPVLTINSLDVRDDVCTERDGMKWIYWGFHPIVTLTESVASFYPELDEAIRGINDYNALWLGRWANQRKAELPKEVVSNPDIPFYMCSQCCFSKLLLARVDNRVLSLLDNSFEYLGGAHGISCLSAWNFDVEQAKRLTLSDVIADVPALSAIITEELPKRYKDASWLALDSIPEVLSDEDRAKTCWHFTENGIVIVFNTYELACYADGELEYELNYADHPELFREPYGRELFKVPAVALKGDSHAHSALLCDPLYKRAQGKWNLHSYTRDAIRYDAQKNGVSGNLSINEYNSVVLKLSGVDGTLPDIDEGYMNLATDMLNKHHWFGADSCWQFFPQNNERGFHALLTDSQDSKLSTLDVIVVTYSKDGTSEEVKLHFVRE